MVTDKAVLLKDLAPLFVVCVITVEVNIPVNTNKNWRLICIIPKPVLNTVVSESPVIRPKPINYYRTTHSYRYHTFYAYVPLEHQYPPTRLHSITAQSTTICTVN
jgi:hypothetical protein